MKLGDNGLDMILDLFFKGPLVKVVTHTHVANIANEWIPYTK